MFNEQCAIINEQLSTQNDQYLMFNEQCAMINAK